MSNKFNLDDIKFVDAVIPIPESTVSIEMEVKVYEDGEIHELKASYNLADIREAIDLFEKTWQGEYPKFVLTERGRSQPNDSKLSALGRSDPCGTAANLGDRGGADDTTDRNGIFDR